ncbi:MAG: preprotein translocase subunit SecG [Nitrospirota bacterium]
MYMVFTIIHILVSFIIIGVILLQAGKGAEIGAAFGGSSQTVFGSRGAATFLSKLTIGAAIVFMLTSISLAVISKGKSTASSLIETKAPVSTTIEQPATTEPKPQEGAPSPEGTNK